jgi:hypothetical protein
MRLLPFTVEAASMHNIKSNLVQFVLSLVDLSVQVL